MQIDEGLEKLATGVCVPNGAESWNAGAPCV